MLTSEKVYEMAQKMNKSSADAERQETETEAKVEEKAAAEEPKAAEVPKEEEIKDNADADRPAEEAKEEAAPEATEEKEVETAKEDKEVPKPKHSKQEQIDYSFKRLKSKNRKLEQRIRELEEENRKIRPDLTLDDFKGDHTKFVNYLVDKKSLEKESEQTRRAYEISRQEEFEAVNAQRIESCFPDEKSRNAYADLVRVNGNAFVAELDENDPEQVVLGYLDDCDIAPLMTSILMTNGEYREQVLGKHSPYMRLKAMEDLENRIRYAQRELGKRKAAAVPVKTEDTKPEAPPKPKIPVVGSVTKSETSNGKTVKDYNSILHGLNQNRYGSH